MTSVHPEKWTSKSREERDVEIVSRLLKADQKDNALEVAKARGTLVWVADDGNADVAYEHAESREDAAKEYVEDGDWGDRSSTGWVTVYTWPRYVVGEVAVDDDGDRESHTITIKAEEPGCADGHEHDWRSPLCLVGGIAENPGVHGHGGGVVITEVCLHCGCKRVTDTWAQNPDTGEQGLESVEYEAGAYDSDELAEAREELGFQEAS